MTSTAFVLGGGGHMGAYEVGMLRALLELGVTPDLIVGTSIGAINGAAIAANPTRWAVERLEHAWTDVESNRIFGGSFLAGALNMFRSRTHMHGNEALRTLIARLVPAKTFADLEIPFQCVAASIERASEHWFSAGPLADAIVASAAVPGVLPPVEIGGEHFIDGGVVNSIPISRAVELGATDIYVLHVGRIDAALTAPNTPLQVALIAFEVARRHRFHRDLESLPPGVVAHVLPTGETTSSGWRQLNYRDFKAITRRIDRAYEATMHHLQHTANP
jgi:NTE family protein